ncbi:hypothetical protein BY996DRAFT_7559230 [Phakopsora pachyrhizi]|nr:hypothetical protein BY996DRAFT_7559230 [Phakopsora pachyrhizi]
MSPQSTCAAKSAFAILALAGIFWSGRSKKFAIDYGLRSGVIPIFVSITPTLGHSYYNIAFRLSGYIIGLAYATV